MNGAGGVYYPQRGSPDPGLGFKTPPSSPPRSHLRGRRPKERRDERRWKKTKKRLPFLVKKDSLKFRPINRGKGDGKAGKKGAPLSLT